MAAAASTEAQKLQYGVQYTARGFPSYFKQLRALCLKQKDASLILSKFSRDPIQHFYQLNASNIDGAEEFKLVGKVDGEGVFKFLDDDKNVIPDALKSKPAETCLVFHETCCKAKVGSASKREEL